MIKVPVYAPDSYLSRMEDGLFTDHVMNLLPIAGGYKSIPLLQMIGDLGVTEEINGAIGLVIPRDDRQYIYIVGTPSHLYHVTIRNSDSEEGHVDTQIEDITPEGGVQADREHRWVFKIFNQYILAIHKGVPLLYIDSREVTSGKAVQFKPVPDAPRGTSLANWGNHLVILGVVNEQTETRDEVAWSGLNNIFEWTPGKETDADAQRFFNGGQVTGASDGKRPVIFTDDVIYRGVYIPSSPLLFEFRELYHNIGLEHTSSLIQIDQAVYFYSTKGFCRLDDNDNLVYIGRGLVDQFVQNFINGAKFVTFIPYIQLNEEYIFWCIKKTNTDSLNDGEFISLVYNYTLERWSRIDINIQAAITYYTTGYSLDSLDAISSSIDELAYSLDSLFWSAGVKLPTIIDTEGRMYSFAGDAAPAEISTPILHQPNDSLFILREFKAETNALVYTAELWYSYSRHGDKNNASKYTLQNLMRSPRRDSILVHKRGRYMQITFQLHRQNYTYFVNGFNIDMTTGGIM